MSIECAAQSSEQCFSSLTILFWSFCSLFFWVWIVIFNEFFPSYVDFLIESVCFFRNWNSVTVKLPFNLSVLLFVFFRFVFFFEILFGFVLTKRKTDFILFYRFNLMQFYYSYLVSPFNWTKNNIMFYFSFITSLDEWFKHFLNVWSVIPCGEALHFFSLSSYLFSGENVCFQRMCVCVCVIVLGMSSCSTKYLNPISIARESHFPELEKRIFASAKIADTLKFSAIFYPISCFSPPHFQKLENELCAQTSFAQQFSRSIALVSCGPQIAQLFQFNNKKITKKENYPVWVSKRNNSSFFFGRFYGVNHQVNWICICG